MGHARADVYFRGTVVEYDDKTGQGFVGADDGNPTTELLAFHRSSLTRPDLSLCVGERVLFWTKAGDRGLVATDLHPEIPAASEGSVTTDRQTGRIKFFNPEKGYGFFHLQDDRDIFFHASQVVDDDEALVDGRQASFRIIANNKGPQAIDIVFDPVLPTASTQTDWLAQAVIAREARNHDEAATLYAKGLRDSPSVQLVTSYAAMEKNRRRMGAAMRVYEEGIRLYPTNAKLREDAGILAASLGDKSMALRLLEQSLSLIREHRQGGEKGALLALARFHYRNDTISSLEQSIGYYEEASRSFGKGRTTLPESDLLTMNIAKIRTQHHRGNLAVLFFRAVSFEIVRASLLDQTTEGAEFVVAIDAPEFRESYGLARHLIVRCVFKSTVNLLDIDRLDHSVAQWSMSGLGDDRVALMIVGSLSEDLQRTLSARIDDRKRSLPAIVPIQQTEIETASEQLVSLRGVLDRWLYRRDLFAGNSPVEGRRFFGRDKPLAELQTAISTSTPVGIFGLRKVGKTSLLKECQRRATEAGDVVVYQDLLRVPSDVSDVNWLYWKLATDLRRESSRLPLKNFIWRLGGEFADFMALPATFPVATAFDSDLTRLLAALPHLGISPRPRIVILLDEIERLLPTLLGKPGFRGFFDFVGYLRGVSQESKDFVLIVTGANSLVSEVAQFEGRDNPVFNFFKEVYLQLLELSECSSMMKELGRGMGIKFHPDAIDYVHRMTGGHPFFARQLCSFVANQHADRPLSVTRRMVESLIDRYLEVRSGDFEEIAERLARDFPDELAVCIELARVGGSVRVEQLRQQQVAGGGSTIRHLTGYQIVSVGRERAELTIDLLTRWLKKRYHTGG